MIKEYKYMIKLQHFPMEQTYLKCARRKCYQKINGVLTKTGYKSDYIYNKNIKVTIQMK